VNYFAHARRHLLSNQWMMGPGVQAGPYFLAGVALPDWLSVIDRRVRARSEPAARLLKDSDPRVVAVARGIIQHHFDDRWFHQTPEFLVLSSQFAVELRQWLDVEQGAQPGFVGHILVELLLDSSLIVENPVVLDRYYEALENLDPHCVESVVNRVSKHPTDMVSRLIPRFIRERFLYDYQEDAKLWMRLNHVMGRVKLPQLPASLIDWLPEARRRVEEAKHPLMWAQDHDPPWDQFIQSLETSPDKET
jgi:hypothetical protein